MKRLIPFVLAAAVGIGSMVIVQRVAGGEPSPVDARPIAAAAFDAAPAPAVATPPTDKPSDQLHNVADDPGGVISDVEHAKSWPLILLVLLIVISRSIGAAAKKWDVGPIDWLDGHAGKYLVVVGTCAAAAFDIVALGGSWMVAAHAALGSFLYWLVPAKAPDTTDGKSKDPAPA